MEQTKAEPLVRAGVEASETTLAPHTPSSPPPPFIPHRAAPGHWSKHIN